MKIFHQKKLKIFRKNMKIFQTHTKKMFQLGERTELKTPFEHAITMTKKDENTFCVKS